MRWFGISRASEPLDILVVCTGNVCRSPFIAAVLRARLPELTIGSAGTDAMVGERPPAEVLRALADRGIEPPTLPAQSLTRAKVRGSRLIVTATRFHRARVVAMESAARARAFTLKELARVSGGHQPPHGLAWVLAHAASTAGALDNVDHDDDLDDPYGLGWPAYEKMATEVDKALGVLVPAMQSGSTGQLGSGSASDIDVADSPQWVDLPAENE